MFSGIGYDQFNALVSPDFLNLRTLLFAIICYVYSSVPFALIFTYLFKREILSRKGSQNVGVANAFGVGGLGAGFSTVAGEISKAALPLTLTHFYYDGAVAVAVVLVFISILGVNFSIFLKGRGGMGTTILLSTLIVLSPFTFLIFAGVFVILFFSTRSAYITVVAGNALLPVEIFLIESNIPFAVFGLFTAVLYCARYDRSTSDTAFYSRIGRFNIPRLRRGSREYLVDLSKANHSSLVGYKASQLHYLRSAGFRVPKTRMFTFQAYEDYVKDGNSVLVNLQTELVKFIQAGKKYCVRSSANLEDERDHSFAGQFESCLNVGTLEEVTNAIVRIWESSKGDRVAAYANRVGRTVEEIKTAVVIQEMIQAEFAGVVFTKNPVNGMDEIIVELVAGSGDLLVQAGVTPERWVYKWGNWLETPGHHETVPLLVSQLVQQARNIARKYGKPVDLEWAYDGKDIYWLQLREITTLRGVNVYSNKIAKEFMPGIIKPLVWSVNISVVNSSWKKLFIELVGKVAKDLNLNNLAKSFYYRAYFNMGVIGDIFELLGMPRESVELIMGIEVTAGDTPKFRPGARTIKYIPRMLLFAINKLMYSKRIERFLVMQRNKIDRFVHADLYNMSEKETLQHIEQLFQASMEASYYVIISQLLMGFYNMLLKRFLSKRGIDIRNLSFARERDLVRDIDFSFNVSGLHDKYESLPGEVKIRIKAEGYNALATLPELNGLKSNTDEFLSIFGHLGESGNDFSRETWLENPDLLLKTIIGYQRPETNESERVEISDIKGSLTRATFLRFIYNRAVKYRVYRERTDFIYTRGYALFRPHFLHLGELFRAKGYLETADDIFYLTFNEIKDVVESGVMTAENGANLIQRKEEIARYGNVSLPGLIVGDTSPIPSTEEEIGTKLRGVGAARGYCEGRTRAVRGIGDFDKVVEGDILVIPYSDITWTPLFSKAKAIISESGGMLSHCSIVAREYNIPTVVSVSGALNIKDGTLVRVDGYTGEVLIVK